MEAGCPIPGAFNVANTLAAVAAAATVGYDAARGRGRDRRGPGVPGRLERVDEGQDFEVVVDYAHKPDAIAAALATLRPVTRGRLVVVLGAGGDRDPGKRPADGGDRGRPAPTCWSSPTTTRAARTPRTIRAAILAGTGAGIGRGRRDR